MAEDAYRLQVARMTAIASLLAEDLVRGWLEERPALSGREILTRLEAHTEERFECAQATEDDLFARDDCRWCCRPIVRIGEGRWTHQNGVTGCRAASFTAKDGWDETLDRRWRASPYGSGDAVRAVRPRVGIP